MSSTKTDMSKLLTELIEREYIRKLKEEVNL